MEKISVIVPVYNVENYLKKCIDSILNQTLEDIEIILVNDGSTDSCKEICDEYARKDNRIKVIHKPNEGLSMARNAGIREARGQYIGFVDSDDYIAWDMYEMLYQNIITYNADISICGLYNCYKEKSIPQYDGDEFLVMNNEEALKTALEGIKFSVNAVNKLYKKELFDNIEFPKGKLSEDAFTIPKILSISSKIVFDSVPKYYYMHREDSITTSKFKEQDFDVVKAYENNLKLIKEDFPHLKKQAEFRLLWAYTYVLDKMILSQDFNDSSLYKKTASTLKRLTLSILLNPFFSAKRKVVTVLFLISPKLYSFMLKYQKKRKMKLYD